MEPTSPRAIASTCEEGSHLLSRPFVSALTVAVLFAVTGVLPACSAGPSAAKQSDGAGSAGGGSSLNPKEINPGAPGLSTADIVVPNCTTECGDFPEEPIYAADSAPGVLSGDVALFGDDPDEFIDSGFCVHEPQLAQGNRAGAMFPANWLRPRFRWTGAAGDGVFEVRLSNDTQKNDLVVYTRNESWTMPEELWKAIAQNTHTPITVTIRGAGSGSVSGYRGTFQIAPVNAQGNMVFWATTTKQISKDGSYLLSFPIGSETVSQALTLQDVLQQTVDGASSENRAITNYDGYSIRDESQNTNKPGHLPGEIQCIGCHVSTPDGDAVVFVDDWPWGKVAANVDPEEKSVGAIPDYISSAGEALLRLPFQGTPTMTPAEWQAGRRLMVTSLAERSDSLYFDAGVTWSGANLVWMNVQSDAVIEPYRGDDPYQAAQDRDEALRAAEGSAWGYLKLSGEEFGAAVTPDWSHDGTRIAYTATSNADNGHPSKSDTGVAADIHIVPFNAGAGGDITALVGASDESAKEYYPAFSEDDEFIAFNKAETGAPYYNGGAEIHIVPAAGGIPTRLNANDPPVCSGEMSPGITNSWAKWSPSVVSHQGKKWYFLVFSSARSHAGQFSMTDPWAPGTPAQNSAQLYMASLVVDEATGAVTDYPAVYLWNQNRVVVDGALQEQMSSNLTPAWDTFKIPPPPPIK